MVLVHLSADRNKERHSFFVPGHALHIKGLQKQIGVGKVVSSQERKAFAVPLMSRLSTVYQTRVNRRLPVGFALQSVCAAPTQQARSVPGFCIRKVQLR